MRSTTWQYAIASAIEIRGDDIFLVLDGLGIVRGSPVSAFTTPR